MYERILFVCTGNTCRSPMAEGIFRQLAAQEGLNATARSAGVSAWDGSPISKHSADILQAKGITDKRTSSSVTKETVEWADLILTMTMGHKELLIRRFPDAIDTIYTLKEFAEDDPAIADMIALRHKLHSELQIKRALGEPITEAEQERARQADAALPGFDIADPFGGDRRSYEKSADEIETYVRKLIRKLRTPPAE
ncbi:low molecular weight protein arginine phosphatase [Paenibacillus sp. GYB003]|uniref:low molecular weight protein arginine phosphatase n=1 Tax=Paenibacillus sp. GYB003 TaxID=2994392 RepID=UPI002F9620DE